MRGDNRVPSREDLQIEFRQIQKAHMPQLATPEWLELFSLWYDDYTASIEAARARAFERVKAFIAQEAPKHRGTPSICPCGAEPDDPGDRAVMAIYQPHFLAAKAAKSR